VPTGSTVPDQGDITRAKSRWAARYTQVGWKVFVLGRDKTPLPNCSDCHNADWTHAREECSCLTCHGFYAATSNLDLLDDMVCRHPDGWLAVRTGSASRLLVLDFEVTGLETLDEFEQWTGVELPPTLRQHTQSGGRHLLYRLPSGVTVKSRNRVLPDMDVKAEGGYAVVPTPGRDTRWWDHSDGREPAPAPAELLDWLVKSRGKAITTGDGGRHDTPSISVDGYDYARFLRDGCPGGARDQFFNDLIFRCRKQNMTRGQAENAARKCWEMCEQPPATEWYMPWEHVQYKLDRVWQTVAPPAPMPTWRPVEVGTTEEGKTIVKQGRTTIVRSEW
jgi:bifunctional DNA primase/polymerase-like protein